MSSSPPAWFYLGGVHMALKINFNPSCKILILQSSSCRLELISRGKPDTFVMCWKIAHDAEIEWSAGQRLISADALRYAFGLDDQPSAEDSDEAEMRKRYEADAAIPGLFVRKGDYLNIPGPHNGFFPPSELSVWITPEIRDYVRRLLSPELVPA